MVKATLQCKNLDDITVAEELAAAREVDAPSTSIRLRKGLAGMQIATIKITVGKATAVDKIRVVWSVCPFSSYESPEAYSKYFEQGHKS